MGFVRASKKMFANRLQRHAAMMLVRRKQMLRTACAGMLIGVIFQVVVYRHAAASCPPIQIAINSNDYDEFVRICKRDPALVNMPVYNEFMPIHCVCMKNRYSMLEYLLNNGCNVNARWAGSQRSNLSGAAPLHFACEFGDESLLSLLLMHGADKRLTNTKGETAHSVAVRLKKATCANMLILETGK
jgi:hypothetical protein